MRAPCGPSKDLPFLLRGMDRDRWEPGARGKMELVGIGQAGGLQRAWCSHPPRLSAA